MGAQLTVRLECEISFDRSRTWPTGSLGTLFHGRTSWEPNIQNLTSTPEEDYQFIFLELPIEDDDDEPFVCKLERDKGNLEVKEEKRFLSQYLPSHRNSELQNATEALPGDNITCASNLSLPVTVTMWEEGHKPQSLRVGQNATALVLSNRTTGQVICEARNKFGVWRDSVTLVGWSNASLAFTDFVTLYEVSCGPGSPSPPASVQLRFLGQLSSPSVTVSWRAGDSSPSFPNASFLQTARYDPESRCLKVTVSRFSSPLRARCRVLLKNNAVHLQYLLVPVIVTPRVYRLILRNRTHESATFVAGEDIYVTCSALLSPSHNGTKERPPYLEGFKERQPNVTISDDKLTATWILNATPRLSALRCLLPAASQPRGKVQRLWVHYLSRPNFSSLSLSPGGELRCFAEGSPEPRLQISSPLSDRLLVSSRSVTLRIPENLRPGNYSVKCLAKNRLFARAVIGFVIVRKPLRAAGSQWHSLWQGIWIAALICSVAFLCLAFGFWWRSRSRPGIETSRRSRTRMKRRTPSPTRTPNSDSGLGTPESPHRGDHSGLVYAKLDFDERMEAKRKGRKKRSKEQKADSCDSIVYDVIVGELGTEV